MLFTVVFFLSLGILVLFFKILHASELPFVYQQNVTFRGYFQAFN